MEIFFRFINQANLFNFAILSIFNFNRTESQL